ncbi:(2Fe-2S)-binding protein [Telmatospirillum sp. J64-1]|uniref:(2Fe-2S)-binding protein n=1 Tax=Telmatospirillum sp. J64-1 TaxID=2502183 RepID=UPI00115F62C4|nr:(2Fe-2S)-binding protein [Telmatospirillum sp. J64-1]
MKITLNVDGRKRDVEAPPDAALLFVLRNDLGVNGPKFGCGLAQCGACTVLVDGQPARSCSLPVQSVEGAKIETPAGLRGEDGSPSPLQKAFLEEQAAQCGYCTSGMIMTATAFLRENDNPTDQEVRKAMDGNLCRCGSHNRIVRAILRAAKEVA